MLDVRKVTRSLWLTKQFRFLALASVCVLLLHNLQSYSSQQDSMASISQAHFIDKAPTSSPKVKPLGFNDALRKLGEFKNNMPGGGQRSGEEKDDRNSIPVQVQLLIILAASAVSKNESSFGK